MTGVTSSKNGRLSPLSVVWAKMGLKMAENVHQNSEFLAVELSLMR